MTALYVAVGGAVGVLARYGLGTTVSGDAVPWLTVAINVTGSFLLGFVIAVGDWFSPDVAPASRSASWAASLRSRPSPWTYSSTSRPERAWRPPADVAASTVLGVGAAATGDYAGRALAR